MNKTIKYFGFAAVGVVAALATSCNMDTPFENGEQGTGTIHLATDIKGETVTRAEIAADDMAALRESAIVYVERKNGNSGRHEVIRKYMGLETIPGQIALAKGHTYIAEGWTGDSVSASFNAKFYRGKSEEFTVDQQAVVALKLNIANVLVSFAPETFELGLSDINMTVSHSRGELTFSESVEGGSTLHNTGYFMMPSTDTSLSYTISAKTADGNIISREGTIENVERAHQYLVRLKGNEAPEWGGGMIKIEIEDIPVIEEEVEIFGRPVIEGVEFDMADQVVGTPGTFTEKIVYVCGYGQIKTLSIGGEKAPAVIKSLSNRDIVNNSPAQTAELNALGITYTHSTSADPSSGKDLDKYTITFSKSFLDALPESSEEYAIEIFAEYSLKTEGDNITKKSNSASLRIANTEEAVEVQAPVVPAESPDPAREPMAITGSKATLTGYLYDDSVADYGIAYREKGTQDWKNVSAKNSANVCRRSATRAGKTTFTVTLTGLKPGTDYEYKCYSDSFDKGEIKTFTTESVFLIPNASFENWSSYSAKTLFGTKNVILPGSEGDKTLSTWGSGNEGAATASMTLTDKSTDMKHSGTYCARLESKSAMGVIAAGNIFVGEYVITDGTNGVLSLGRPYNGSHPEKLKVWANYRPTSGVKVESKNSEYLPANFEGGKDHGQIYVALTTEPVEIRTNPSDRKVFDSENDPTVLAYGQITWTDDFGPDGSLAAVEIPIKYKEAAKSKAAKYLVIVVSASKYGDYFSGAAGSVFYLDDFELIY